MYPAWLVEQENDLVFLTPKNTPGWRCPQNRTVDVILKMTLMTLFPFLRLQCVKSFFFASGIHTNEKLQKLLPAPARRGVTRRRLWHLSAAQMMGLCSQVLPHPAVPPRRERAEQTGYNSFHLFSPVIFICDCWKSEHQRCRGVKGCKRGFFGIRKKMRPQFGSTAEGLAGFNRSAPPVSRWDGQNDKSSRGCTTCWKT